MGRRTSPPIPLKAKWQIHRGETLSARLAEGFKQNKKADSSRINVVSPKLCDDALQRLRHSLSAYQGCDIIDLNPGNCMWSLKLHEVLKPRWHALVEPDAHVYTPYLEDAIKTSPSVFSHVAINPYEKGFWSRFLEQHAQEMESLKRPKVESGINRSLLVIANLGTTRKITKAFNSPLAPFYIQNFVEAMYEKQHVHQHGFVKMLAWMSNEQTHGLFPRTVSARTRVGTVFDSALASKCIVGRERSNLLIWRYRRHWPIDQEVSKRVAASARQAHIYDPPERQQLELGQHPASLPNTPEGRATIRHLPNKDPFFDDLLKLEEGAEKGKITRWTKPDGSKRKVTPEWRSLGILRARHAARNRQYEEIQSLLEQRIVLDEKEKVLSKASGARTVRGWETLESQIQSWRTNPSLMRTTPKEKLLKDVDDWRGATIDPPALSWDRREAEPLRAEADEFFPKDVMALVDLEPRPQLVEAIDSHEKHTCLRYLGLLVGTSGSQTVEELLQILTPGAGAEFAAKVPSLLDPSKGGGRFLYDVRMRTLPIETIVEVAVALEKFPLRPSISEMKAQMMSMNSRRRLREESAD